MFVLLFYFFHQMSILKQPLVLIIYVKIHKYSNSIMLLRIFSFLHFQLFHCALYHLQLVRRYAKRLVDVAKRPFQNGFVG